MSRLIAALLAGFATLGAATGARAKEGAAPPASPAKDAVWTIDGRVGYAAAWSTGVSHLGIGEGLALGRTWGWGLHLELSAAHFEGQRITAGNAMLEYVASYHSYAMQAGAGWELRAAFLHVRPGVQSGVSFIEGKTKLGSLALHDDIARLMFGPSLAAFVQISHFHVGAAAEAFFVPSTVAAPTLGVFGLFGGEL